MPHIRRNRARYGAAAVGGIGALLGYAAPPAPPTAQQFMYQAVTDADQWWIGQGSTPPPAQIEIGPRQGTESAYGYYGTGQLEFSDSYLRTLNDQLQHGPLRARRLLLAQLWGLAAHERGHNIGYNHDPGGIMNPDLPVIPGRAYEWAAKMLPRKKGR